MKLPLPFTNIFKKTKEEEQNYLSLLLTPNEILAAIWEFTGEQPQTTGFDKRTFTTVDSIVHQAAVTIDKAASLAKSDVSKVTFGLSHFWLENGELTKETSRILKNLSEDLELEAQAYISLASAINHLLKFEEAITPNAILVGNFEDFCEVHLLANNQVIETKTTKGKVNTEKLIALISQFKKEDKDLPSRLIFYGTEQKDELKEVNWQNLFIHEPKISFIEDSQLTKAVALSQAQDILGHEPISTALLTDTTKISKTEQFGFIEGEDILLTKGEKVETEETENKDLPIEREHPLQNEDYAVNVDDSNKKSQSFKKSFVEAAVTVGWLPKLLDNIKNRLSGKRIAIILAALIAMVLIGAFIAGQFLTWANITIKIKSQQIENDINAQVGLGTAASSAINGEEISSQVEGSQKAVATGNKKIGQSAKGEVTVFNITSTTKTFPKGATIITNSGLKFTLDEEVEATSASKPGQASITKTRVTASELGPQYNLDPGQQFSFTQFDEFSYWAQNDASLTGGDEKEVTVVSAEDQDKLAKSLKDTLFEKAKLQLKEKSKGTRFDNNAVIIKVLKSEFDKKTDEEASLVTLSMQTEASVIVYDELKLKEKLAQSIGDQVPENSQVRAQDIEILDLSTKRNENSLTLGGKFKALLIPKFNEEELKGKIAGKSEKEARSKILEIGEVSDVEFKFSPNIPIAGTISKDKSKINFTIEAI